MTSLLYPPSRPLGHPASLRLLADQTAANCREGRDPERTSRFSILEGSMWGAPHGRPRPRSPRPPSKRTAPRRAAPPPGVARTPLLPSHMVTVGGFRCAYTHWCTALVLILLQKSQYRDIVSCVFFLLPFRILLMTRGMEFRAAHFSPIQNIINIFYSSIFRYFFDIEKIRRFYKKSPKFLYFVEISMKIINHKI